MHASPIISCASQRSSPRIQKKQTEEEEGAILVFTQVKEEGEDRVPIDREEFATIFAEAVIDFSIGIPPQMGSFDPKSRYGPYRVATKLEHALAFEKAVDNMIGTVRGQQVELEVKVINLLDEVRKAVSAPPKKSTMSHNLLDSLTVHVSMELAGDIEFFYCKPGDIAAAWRSEGFVVEKINRQKLIYEGKRTSTKGATMHANVRPFEGRMDLVAWPPELNVAFKVAGEIVRVKLGYKIHEHIALNGKICAEGCHLYKPHHIFDTLIYQPISYSYVFTRHTSSKFSREAFSNQS